VQVDPIKPTLKAPGTKRLKLNYEVPLSNFAFKSNVRLYIKSAALAELCCRVLEPVLREFIPLHHHFQARAYTRPLFSST
jgi:hypothetical protein